MNNIKMLREARGLSQHCVSEQMQISQQAVAKWETGDSLPRADKLPLSAEILGCSVDDLFNDTTEADK